MQKSVYITDYKNNLSNYFDINSEIFQYESHIKKSLKRSNTASIYELYFIGRCQNILSNMILWKVSRLTLPHWIWYPGEKGQINVGISYGQLIIIIFCVRPVPGKEEGVSGWFPLIRIAQNPSHVTPALVCLHPELNFSYLTPSFSYLQCWAQFSSWKQK